MAAREQIKATGQFSQFTARWVPCPTQGCQQNLVTRDSRIANVEQFQNIGGGGMPIFSRLCFTYIEFFLYKTYIFL